MRRRDLIWAVITAPILTAASCGYPDFTFGPGGGGNSSSASSSTGGVTSGSGGATASSSTASSTTSSTTSTTASSTAASSGTGGTTAACEIPHLLISEVRTRGPGGADDEFVELFNPTGSDVLLDPTWTLQGRKAGITTTYSAHWTASFQTIPAHGYLLLAGSGYTQLPTPDDNLSLGLTDAAGLTLQAGFVAVDSLCFYNDAVTQAYLQNFLFTCEGTPVLNAHDDSDGTDTDTSLERRKSGGVDDCTDTNNNAFDFVLQSPATPVP